MWPYAIYLIRLLRDIVNVQRTPLYQEIYPHMSWWIYVRNYVMSPHDIWLVFLQGRILDLAWGHSNWHKIRVRQCNPGRTKYEAGRPDTPRDITDRLISVVSISCRVVSGLTIIYHSSLSVITICVVDITWTLLCSIIRVVIKAGVCQS
jgi:hypothetical protein